MSPHAPKSVCLHAQHTIGDLLCAAAAAASLKEKRPELRLYWHLAPQPLQTLFKNMPEIHAVVDHPSKAPGPYVDIHPYAYPQPYPPGFLELHMLEKAHRTAEYHFGPLRRRERPYYVVSPDDIDVVRRRPLPERFITIHSITSSRTPGDLRTRRNWPLERFNELVPRLPLPAVQIGAADDPPIEGAYDLRGLPIHLSAALIHLGEALVGLESGPSYIADALDKPCVVLHDVGASGGVETCGPVRTTCTRLAAETILHIQVDQVLAALHDALRRSREAPGPVVWQAPAPQAETPTAEPGRRPRLWRRRPRRRLRWRWRRRRFRLRRRRRRLRTWRLRRRRLLRRRLLVRLRRHRRRAA